MKKHKTMNTNNTKMETCVIITSPFDLLTEEIILMILDYLSNDSFAQKSFSLTCKTFYFLESRHRKTLRPLHSSSNLLSKTLQRFPSINHLDLSLCPRVDDNTLNVLSSTYSSNLLSINLSRSRFFTSAGLSNLVTNCLHLKEIDLSNGTKLGDMAAAAIAEAKNLERLWLTRCKMITDMGIGCVAVGCTKLKLLCLKWCLRVGDLGVKLVALKCKEITSLDLSFLPITEKCLPSILQLQNLEDLVLEGCLGIDDDGLVILKQSCKSLKRLDASHCQDISHIGLSLLINGAESLQQLNLARGSALTADLAKCLHSLKGLQSVKLDGCSVTSSGIIAMSNWHATLKELSLSKCSGVTDESISILVQAHKELRKLDITCCRKITYASIDSITNSCTSLTTLLMESCSLVSKEAFVLIGRRCKYLEELDVTDNEIDDEGLKSIARCSRLACLKLGICLNITDSGLVQIGHGCSKLQELDLYRSPGVTDIGVAAIALSCPLLEMVNLSYNDNITDASLISLSKCVKLKALEIRGCPCVSSLGLSAIARECRQLSVLDIKKCFNINDKGMLSLAQYSPNLKQINLSYCSVTDAGLLALASMSRLQNMTILHLAGLTPGGLAAGLVANKGLAKVKLHASFKSLIPQSLLEYMEACGCVFQWRDKAFEMNMDPKGWKLHLGRLPQDISSNIQ